ncbi:MAG: hypothetical protein IPH58_13915 [Sphingobacteriales bacterium]|jgi:hypothetical protein|nr:hypothetical protein [Sphingobacteriales bacterium]
MRGIYLFILTIALFGFTVAVAQTSTAPEIPKHYKPAPKALLPMPGELTENEIFPVLGRYEISNEKGELSKISISNDAENKGVIWISGLVEGKFYANLKESPATYKIFPQKLSSDESLDSMTASKKSSGKSIEEGTIIFDKELNKIYLNIGNKYNENDPSLVFNKLKNDTTEEVAGEEIRNSKTNKNKKGKKAVSKSVNYTGSKILDNNLNQKP